MTNSTKHQSSLQEGITNLTVIWNWTKSRWNEKSVVQNQSKTFRSQIFQLPVQDRRIQTVSYMQKYTIPYKWISWKRLWKLRKENKKTHWNKNTPGASFWSLLKWFKHRSYILSKRHESSDLFTVLVSLSLTFWTYKWEDGDELGTQILQLWMYFLCALLTRGGNNNLMLWMEALNR